MHEDVISSQNYHEWCGLKIIKKDDETARTFYST